MFYIKDKEGTLLGNIDDKLKRWKEYFEVMLNESNEQENKDELSEEGYCYEGNQIDEEPSDEKIYRLKNNKSPSENGTVAEILKYGVRSLQVNIIKLVQEIWKEETMPMSIFQKDDRTECMNYRGIALQDAVYKIVARIIKERLKTPQKKYYGNTSTNLDKTDQ